MLGVARTDEGIELRRSGIDAPVLIFGYTSPDAVADLLTYDLTPTVFSCATAEAMSVAALAAGKRLAVHVKVDTGMGRVGFLAARPPDRRAAWAASAEIEGIARLEGLVPGGNLHPLRRRRQPGQDQRQTPVQRFMDTLAALADKGVTFPLRHAANSGAVIDMPETHLDMVRPGIAVYGLYPSDEVEQEPAYA